MVSPVVAFVVGVVQFAKPPSASSDGKVSIVDSVSTRSLRIAASGSRGSAKASGRGPKARYLVVSNSTP